jgi:hypothetical protein
MVEVITPPTIGAAIGFITSESMPVSQRIRQKADKDGAYGHHFGLQTLDRTFDRCGFYVGIRQSRSRLQFLFERADFNGDAKKRDVLQASANLLQMLDDSRACPVEVGAILKYVRPPRPC